MGIEQVLVKAAVSEAARRVASYGLSRLMASDTLKQSMEALKKNPANHAFVEKMAESLGVLDAGEPAKQRIDFSAVRPKHKTTAKGPKHHFTKG